MVELLQQIIVKQDKLREEVESGENLQAGILSGEVKLSSSNISVLY